MGKFIMGQMEDAYQECILNMLPAIKVSRELRRDYYYEISGIDVSIPQETPIKKEEGWHFLTYKGVGIVPEDSPFWKPFLEQI